MERDLILILQKCIEEVLLNESGLLKELKVKIVYLESKRHVKLTSFLVRTLETFSRLICYHLIQFDLLADL